MRDWYDHQYIFFIWVIAACSNRESLCGGQVIETSAEPKAHKNSMLRTCWVVYIYIFINMYTINPSAKGGEGRTVRIVMVIIESFWGREGPVTNSRMLSNNQF